MRLKTSKSKNATLYYIIKDYTNIKGKRTTKIYEKLLFNNGSPSLTVL